MSARVRARTRARARATIEGLLGGCFAIVLATVTATVTATALAGCGEPGRPVAPVTPVETVAIPPAPVSSGPFLDVAPPNATTDPPRPGDHSVTSIDVDPSTTPSTAPDGSCAPFDRGAAARTLGSVNVQRCNRPGGQHGAGHVTITFAPVNGHVISVVVDAGPFSGTPEGACVAALFRSAAVPPFCGPQSITVGKSFAIP